jgi:predicted SprT family Zn-dependent metalloprotease
MKKQKFKRARKRFNRIALEWATRMGLKWWSLHFLYYGKTPKKFRREDGHQTAVRVLARWQYLEAYFEVNTPAIARMSDSELEALVVHEMCHVLVNEMREKGIKHEERVCSRLAQAFLWTKE